MARQVLLGDEALALGAVHAGLSAAYSYPGTPASEIMEFLLRLAAKEGGFKADLVRQRESRLRGGPRRVLRRQAGHGLLQARRAQRGRGPVHELGHDRCQRRPRRRQRRRPRHAQLAERAGQPLLRPVRPGPLPRAGRPPGVLRHGPPRPSTSPKRLGLPVLIRLVTRLSHSRSSVETARAAAAECAPHRRLEGLDASPGQRPAEVPPPPRAPGRAPPAGRGAAGELAHAQRRGPVARRHRLGHRRELLPRGRGEGKVGAVVPQGLDVPPAGEARPGPRRPRGDGPRPRGRLSAHRERAPGLLRRARARRSSAG